MATKKRVEGKTPEETMAARQQESVESLTQEEQDRHAAIKQEARDNHARGGVNPANYRYDDDTEILGDDTVGRD